MRGRLLITVLMMVGIASLHAAAAEDLRPSLDSPPVALAAADVDGDGTNEIITAVEDGRVLILRHEQGGLRVVRELEAGGTPTAMTLEQSGRLPHILVVTRDPGQLVVFSPDGRSSHIRTVFPVRGAPTDVTIRRSSERNMKNAMVVATTEEGRDGLEIFESCYGCPCGSKFHPAGVGASSVAALDIDYDGVEEIVTASAGSRELTLLVRSGGTTYIPAAIVDLGAIPVGSVRLRIDDASELAVIVSDPNELLMMEKVDATFQITQRLPLPFLPRGIAAMGTAPGTAVVWGESREILAISRSGKDLQTEVIAVASAVPRTLTVTSSHGREALVVGTEHSVEILPVQ